MESVARVLEVMGPSPADFIMISGPERLKRTFAGFKYRMTTGKELVDLLLGMRDGIGKYGSLNDCFLSGMSPGDENILPALCRFAYELKGAAGCLKSSLLPAPEKGSACKRLNLFLRWMVRRDHVDPGGWSGVEKSRLIVPLDTHMYRICFNVGLTRRKRADMRAALEITDGFREFAPGDPVKYDFAIAHLGMREEASAQDFF